MQTSTACDFFRKYEPWVHDVEFFPATFFENGGEISPIRITKRGSRGGWRRSESKCRLRYSRAARSERARAPCRFIRKFKKVARFTRCKASCHPLHRRERRLSFSRRITARARCRALPVARDLSSLPPGRLTRSTTFLHSPREVWVFP